MKIGEFDLDKKVMVVAEVGNNHEGSFAVAQKMVKLAAESGADAVKFQTIRAEHLVRRSDSARFRQLKSFELSDAEFEALSKTAKREGLIFLSTPFDLAGAEFLNTLVPAFKVASGDNTFYPLIDKVASFGKPVIVSTGLLGIPEIDAVKRRIEGRWAEAGVAQEVAVLHCVCSYPVAPQDAGLGAIREMIKALGCTVGYSDHTIGTEAAVMSVAMGARIIEKHFTLDKKHSDFRDHQLSADPDDMAELVRNVRWAEQMVCSEKVVRDSEKVIEAAVRRSVAAARDLKAGTEIEMDNITWVRPSGGIPPGEEKIILGRVLKKDIPAGEFIMESDTE